MKGLKKSVVLIACAAVLLVVSLSVVADKVGECPRGLAGGPGMMGQGPHQMGPLGRVADELGLTDEQKAEIRTIVAEEMPAARQRIEERVAGVLTAEQQSRLEELKEEHPGAMREGRGRGMCGPGGPGSPGARLERMAEALDLTDEQQKAISEILAAAAPPKRSEIREQINNVLTPEQLEKMEELHEERRTRMVERHGPDNGKVW